MLIFSQRLLPASGYLTCGLVLVFIVFYSEFQSLPVIIQNDTIWHLSVSARVMLVALASCASMAIALFCLVKAQFLQRKFLEGTESNIRQFIFTAIADLALTVVCLWLAFGVAPQVFYALYVAVIPGLPAQWVISTLSWGEYVNLTKLSTALSLSSFVSGVLWWTSVLATAVYWATAFVQRTTIKSR